MRAADRAHIDVEDTRKLKGSVDLDSTLQRLFPNESRWDYAIGYARTSTTLTVYWVEIHPASASHLGPVLDKLNWLKNWLANNAPRLNALPKQFHWVSSGSTAFTQASPQAKRLAQLGLRHSGRQLRIQ